MGGALFIRLARDVVSTQAREKKGQQEHFFCHRELIRVTGSCEPNR